MEKKEREGYRFILSSYGNYLIRLLPILSWIVDKNELSIYIPFHKIYEIFLFLRDHTFSQYKILVDLTAVDYPSRGRFRFDLVYQLLSIRYNSRLRVKTSIQDGNHICSITNIYKNADWWEREVYDMFGLFFEKHKDLRRMLTDYGFQGHPLRKDFPLTGFFEIRYDNLKYRMVYEKVELAQKN